MNKIDELLEEVKEMPEPALEEVLDFVRFLKAKQASELNETAMLSEPALAKDWLRPEEDEAWRHL
jgi:hypothetical protein